MKNSKINYKNLLAPTDSIAVVVVLIGLAIAIFIEQIEIRLIGVSIAILGIVAFFMLISQRLKDFIDTKFFSRSSTPPPNIRITEIQDGKAKRQVIEDLETSLDSDFDKVKKRENEASKNPGIKTKTNNDPVKFTPTVKEFSHDEHEGFAVIGKSKTKDAPVASSKHLGGSSSKKNAEYSGMRIINKKSNEIEEVDSPKQTTPLETIQDESHAQIITNPIVEKSSDTVAEKSTDIAQNLFDQLIDNSKNDKTSESKADDNKKAKGENDNLVEATDLFNIPEFNNSGDTTYKELAEQIGYQDLDAASKLGNKKKTNAGAICKKNQLDVPLSILTDDNISDQEPRNEFAGFVSRALMVIRSMASTTTAAFFIVNLEKEELILETFVTDSPDAIVDNPKIKIGSDVISQIVMSGKPEILTEINPSAELDLIPYYKKNVGSSSFIGLPVFYKDSIIGALCADTSIADAYDSVTVGFFGHFTKLIGGLVISYTEKHELLQASRALNAVADLRRAISVPELNIKMIADAVVNSALDIFDFKSIGIVCFDYNDGKWKVFSYRSRIEGANIQGKEIDLNKSMIGESINRTMSLNLSINGQSPVRVHSGEPKMQNGYFVAAPALSLNKIYGALFIEAANKSNITSYDIKILEALAEQTGTALEQLHLNKMIQSASMIDVETGLLNTPAFYRRLEEEAFKNSEFGLPFTVCSFQTDNYSSLNPQTHKDRYMQITRHIVETIRRDLKPYDIFGRLDSNVFCVALVGMPLNEAQLWMERIRTEVAGASLTINKKKYSVTISAGVATQAKNDNAEALLNKASKALAIAAKKTNNVTIFA
jgi:diguanylate cyclase (GGDEF)-like protein